MRPLAKLALATAIAVPVFVSVAATWGARHAASPSPVAAEPPIRVDVHLMSRCQFSLDLVKQLVPIAQRLGPRVQLELSHVGNPGPDGSIAAPHGAPESLGNKLQLCAKDVGGRERWLKFLQCQAASSALPPEGWQECAAQADLDEATLGSCAFGSHGDALLAASFQRSNAKQVASTPTVFINGEVHQGGRGAAFLARAVCKAMGSHAEPACAELVTAPRVTAVVVEDRRCVKPACRTDNIREFLDYAFANVGVRTLDWTQPEAQRLFKDSQASTLPLLLLDGAASQDSWGFEQARSAVRTREGSSYPFVIEFPSQWDPRTASSTASLNATATKSTMPSATSASASAAQAAL
jgi:hypothetical protein